MPDSAVLQGRRPDFVLVGAMKCGTSTLHDQLAENARLFLSKPKEPNFFSDEERWARGFSWYESLFAEASPEQLCGESSTHYSKRPTHPLAAERLVEALPNARILYVIRDPIERIVSQYIHEWSRREVEGSLDQAVRSLPHFIGYSRYAMQLRPYLEAFGTGRVLVVFFERLMARPDAEMDRIGRFLEVPERLVWCADRSARNPSSERLRASPLRDALVNAPLLRALRRRFIPQAWRNRAKEFWQMRERPELSAESRRALAHELDPDLAELGEWLGTPLRCADFRSVAAGVSGDWAPAARDRFPDPA